jgi:hypothetical protein
MQKESIFRLIEINRDKIYKKLIPWQIVCIFLSAPKMAYANVGVPMIFFSLPLMVIALIPIILVETVLFVRFIKINFWIGLKMISIANLVSTSLGIPFTWGILVFLQMISGGGTMYGLDTTAKKFLAVTWQSPWLIPYESNLYWMVPSAMLALCVPFFFASWFVEYKTVSFLLKNDAILNVRSGLFYANLLSYLLLSVYLLYWLLFAKPL